MLDFDEENARRLVAVPTTAGQSLLATELAEEVGGAVSVGC